MNTTEAVTRLIDVTVDSILAVDPQDLPLHGKFWTLRITDQAVLLRIQAIKVNDNPQPRHPPKEPDPPPPPPDDPPPPPPDQGDQT